VILLELIKHKKVIIFMTLKFFKGFTYAFVGIQTAFRSQLNLKIHILAVSIVCIFSWLIKVSITDFVIFLLLFSIVIASELFNTCIEEIANFVRDLHKLDYKATKNLRDMAAGAVLVNAIVATIIGLLIFAKYL